MLIFTRAWSGENPVHVLCPGFVGMRGQWLYDYGMQDYEYTPPYTVRTSVYDNVEL